MGRDFYKILGVDRNADERKIRKAYKKLVVRWHPDRNPNNKEEAQKMFKDISDAYDVLSDKEKKEIYDKHGEEGLKKGGMGNADPSSVFEHFFGGFGGSPFGGGGRKPSGPQRGEDIGFQLGVELADLYNGKLRKLKVNKNVICPTCEGEGSKKKGATVKCSSCNGRGMKVEIRNLGPGFVSQSQSVCSDCRGKGETIPEKDKCTKCKGKKVISEPKILEVQIDKGMKDGERISFHGEADQYPGTLAGDIVVILKEKNEKNPNFVRKGNDLFYHKEISLSEALTGFKFPIVHLDGRVLVVSSQEGDVLKPGDFKVISEQGMPVHKRPYEKGNLVIQFDIKFPSAEQISEENRKTLRQILPPIAEFEMPTPKEGTEPENFVAHDYIPSRSKTGRSEAYDSDEDDHHQQRGGQCANM